MNIKITFLSIFIVSLSLITSIVIGQTAYIKQWEKTFGGSYHDRAKATIPTEDGGYLMAGTILSNDGDITDSHGNEDAWLVKMNSIGVIQWKKSYGGSNDDGANDIIQTTDGGYIVAGYSSSIDGDLKANKGFTDCWIIKLDSIGNIVWQKNYGGGGADAATSVKQTFDGGYIICSISSSNDGDVTKNNGQTDYWIFKIDSIGKLIWQKSYGGSNLEYANSIIQSNDGGFVVVGSTLSNDGDVAFSYGKFDIWILKLSSIGNIIWKKSIGGSQEENCYKIINAKDSGYVLGASSASIDGDLINNTHFGSTDFLLIKIKESGIIEWQQNHGGSKYDIAYDIKSTIDGGYIMGGTSASDDGELTDNFGLEDFWIIKLDSAGLLKWQKNIGGSNRDYANSVFETKDSGFVISGYTYSNDYDISYNHGTLDYWIVKLGSPLLPLTLESFTGVLIQNKIQLNWKSINEVNTNKFKIEYSKNTKDFYELGIVNAIGTRNNLYSFTHNISNRETVYYRLKIIDIDGYVQYSKIIRINPNRSEKEEIKIFLNPLNNIVTVLGENIVKLVVYSQEGKLISTRSYSNETNTTLSIRSLPKDIYYLQIHTTDGGITMKKILKY